MKYSTLFTLVLISRLCGAQNAVFDSDPDHPWNRLHRELYTGTTLDGKPHYRDGVDAEIASRPRFGIGVASARGPIIDALDDFLSAGSDELIRDPLKRALMQRDLWAVFTELSASSSDLRERLVRVMRSIALSPEEIDTLPDNLSQAANDGAFPETYDTKHPDRAFLPTDLAQPGGPWVILKRRDAWLTAPIHVQLTHGRGLFLVLLRVPGGRDATERYLAQLEEAQDRREEVPQFPLGTQVALQRRMMLIDNEENLHVSPLTESLQIRVYQRIDAPDNFEFMLNRKDLFELRAGGLCPSQPHQVSDRELAEAGIGFRPPAETDPSQSNESTTPQAPIQVESCVVCHAGFGIFGLQSVFSHHPSPLGPTNLEDQIAAAIKSTYGTAAWEHFESIAQKASLP